MSHGIAIVGANGSGKTTFGRYLAVLLGYRHLDIEDYYFMDSAIPYTNSRTDQEVQTLLAADMNMPEPFILSAVNCDFGDEINAMYDCVIYLKAPLDVRLNRVKQRSVDQFGNRVLKGGDMFHQEQKFFDFVASRSMEQTERWLESVTCPVICLDGTDSMENNAKVIKKNFCKGNVGDLSMVLDGHGNPACVIK